MEFQPFRYMAWAKAHDGLGEFRLHASGMPAASLADLGVPPGDVRADPFPGTPALRRLSEAVGTRYGVPPECVFPTCGTHHANLLVARALAGPGDRVLVEEPFYEAVPGVFRMLGAEVVPFRRRRERGWRLPLDEIRAGLAAGARVVALTDLHNPTGTRVLPDEWASLEGACREFDARVLVDEVFRDFLPVPPGTAFHPDGPFVVTSSLTKVYGLGGLRCGWVLAPPPLRDLCAQINDFVVVNMPLPTVSIALAAWPRLDARAAAARELAGRNVRLLADWVRGRNDVRWSPPDGGITAFLELDALAGVDDVRWCRRLLEERSVGVVPGSMFGAPGSLRVSFGLPTDRFREALSRLAAHLAAPTTSFPE